MSNIEYDFMGRPITSLVDTRQQEFGSTPITAPSLAIPKFNTYAALSDVGAGRPLGDTAGMLTETPSWWGGLSGMEQAKVGLGAAQIGMGLAQYFQQAPLLEAQTKALKENIKGAKFNRLSMQDRQKGFNSLNMGSPSLARGV